MTGHGHYKATCDFCERVWNCGKPKRMAAHLSNNCLQVPQLMMAVVITCVGSIVWQ